MELPQMLPLVLLFRSRHFRLLVSETCKIALDFYHDFRRLESVASWLQACWAKQLVRRLLVGNTIIVSPLVCHHAHSFMMPTCVVNYQQESLLWSQVFVKSIHHIIELINHKLEMALGDISIDVICSSWSIDKQEDWQPTVSIPSNRWMWQFSP